MAREFISGWDAEIAKWSLEMMPFRSMKFSAPVVEDDRSLMPAVSLSKFILWPHNQGQAGTCFPPGTRVRMADGSERRIEDIRLFDTVLTAEGNTGEVLQLHARRYRGTLVNLKLWGHSHLRMTPEHPVLTERGYVQSGDIQIGDWVALPRYMPESSAILQTAEHVRPLRRTLNRTRFIQHDGIPGKAVSRYTIHALPDAIHLTPGAGRIFGLFLAEGSTDSHKIIWTFNVNEEETLVADLVRLLKEEWSLDPHVRRVDCQHVIRVTVHGKLWAELFESTCSKGAGFKKISPALMSAPKTFLEAMLRGWLDGDGSAHGTGERGVSVSHDLALGMYDIAQAVGLMPSFLKCRPTVNRYAKIRQPRWEVSLQSKGENYRVKQDDRYVWRSVRGLEHEDYEGPVFNIGVEGDNSYVAEGIGVHNCWANSPTQTFQIMTAAEGEYEPEQLSRMMTCYGGSRLSNWRNPTDGNSVLNGLLAMGDEPDGVGVCHESLWPYHEDWDKYQLRTYLATKPPPNAVTDAKANRVHQIAPTKNDDERRRLIMNGIPIALGISWGGAWDSPRSMIDFSGSGWGGHAVAMIGYALPGVLTGADWYEIVNSHGPIYPVLPAEHAAKVPGYKPTRGDRTHTTWIRGDYMRAAIDRGGQAEQYAAASLTGFKKKKLNLDYSDAFPI